MPPRRICPRSSARRRPFVPTSLAKRSSVTLPNALYVPAPWTKLKPSNLNFLGIETKQTQTFITRRGGYVSNVLKKDKRNLNLHNPTRRINFQSFGKRQEQLQRKPHLMFFRRFFCLNLKRVRTYAGRRAHKTRESSPTVYVDSSMNAIPNARLRKLKLATVVAALG